MSLQPRAEVTLTIEKAVAGGRMLARHEGQIVFVAGAIPGERVRVRVARVQKQLAFADTIGVLEASPARRAATVDWACGGCLYAHITYAHQLSLKSAVIEESFARIGKVKLPSAVPVMPSEEHGYRMRARLHAQNGTFGFFREGTHDICDPAPTGQLLPSTIESLGRLRRALESAKTDVVSCELVENVPASERAVLLEIAPQSTPPLNNEPVDGISGVLFADPHSSRLTVAYGSPFVTDVIDVSATSVRLTHHAQSFFQANRYLLSDLVKKMSARVPNGSVLDLYAGVGLFAVVLAARGAGNIVAVEGDRSSARDLETNAAPFGGSIRVHNVAVEAYVKNRFIERPDTIIVDPPRTGMSSEAMKGILTLSSPNLVYVSCDPATLARDVRRLVDFGYALDHVEAFDLFPNTAHVETLAVLRLETGPAQSRTG